MSRERQIITDFHRIANIYQLDIKNNPLGKFTKEYMQRLTLEDIKNTDTDGHSPLVYIALYGKIEEFCKVNEAFKNLSQAQKKIEFLTTKSRHFTPALFIPILSNDIKSFDQMLNIAGFNLNEHRLPDSNKAYGGLRFLDVAAYLAAFNGNKILLYYFEVKGANLQVIFPESNSNYKGLRLLDVAAHSLKRSNINADLLNHLKNIGANPIIQIGGAHGPLMMINGPRPVPGPGQLNPGQQMMPNGPRPVGYVPPNPGQQMMPNGPRPVGYVPPNPGPQMVANGPRPVGVERSAIEKAQRFSNIAKRDKLDMYNNPLGKFTRDYMQGLTLEDIEKTDKGGYSPLFYLALYGKMEEFCQVNEVFKNLSQEEKKAKFLTANAVSNISILFAPILNEDVKSFDQMLNIARLNLNEDRLPESNSFYKGLRLLDVAAYLVAFNGNKTIFDYFMTKGAKLEVVFAESDSNYSGLRLLDVAAINIACNDNKTIFDDLVIRGANLEAIFPESNSKFKGLRLLDVTAFNVVLKGNKTLFDALVAKGANLEDRFPESNANLKGLRLLDDAAYIAACNGHKTLFDDLVAKGANLEARFPEGHSSFKGLRLLDLAAFNAACNGHKTLFDDLVDKGANLEARFPESHPNYKGLRLLDVAAYLVAYNGHKTIFDYLVDKGANLEAIFPESNAHYKGLRLLDIVAINVITKNNTALLSDLILLGARFEEDKIPEGNPNFNGLRLIDLAFHYAARYNNISLLGNLITRGVNFEVRLPNTNSLYKGLRLLDVAAFYISLHGHKRILSILLGKGADINVKIENNKNAIEAAKNQEIKALLEEEIKRREAMQVQANQDDQMDVDLPRAYEDEMEVMEAPQAQQAPVDEGNMQEQAPIAEQAPQAQAQQASSLEILADSAILMPSEEQQVPVTENQAPIFAPRPILIPTVQKVLAPALQASLSAPIADVSKDKEDNSFKELTEKLEVMQERMDTLERKNKISKAKIKALELELKSIKHDLKKEKIGKKRKRDEEPGSSLGKNSRDQDLFQEVASHGALLASTNSAFSRIRSSSSSSVSPDPTPTESVAKRQKTSDNTINID